MARDARNIAIIAAVALAVAFVPGGSNAASAILGVLSIGFLAALGFLGYRLYMENRFTLWSMSTPQPGAALRRNHRRDDDPDRHARLWESGLGTLLWFVLLGGSVLAVYQAWVESRRYGV